MDFRTQSFGSRHNSFVLVQLVVQVHLNISCRHVVFVTTKLCRILLIYNIGMDIGCCRHIYCSHLRVHMFLCFRSIVDILVYLRFDAISIMYVRQTQFSINQRVELTHCHTTYLKSYAPLPKNFKKKIIYKHIAHHRGWVLSTQKNLHII